MTRAEPAPGGDAPVPARADDASPARRPWRPSAILLLAGLLAAAILVGLARPSLEWMRGPLSVQGRPDQPVDIGDATVRIDGVRAAEELAGEATAGDEGVFVIVDLTVTPEGVDTQLDANLVVDGLRYGESTLSTDPGFDRWYQGAPVAGSVVFELPRSVLAAAADARVEVRTGYQGIEAWDGQAVVDLPLAGIDLDGAAETRPWELAP